MLCRKTSCILIAGLILFLAEDLDAKADEANHQQSQPEPESVIIPLNQIWAYGMPGTCDIRKLLADKLPYVSDWQLVKQIRRSLYPSSQRDKQAGTGFAVLGTKLDALRHAHAVLAIGNKHRDEFPAGSETSVVFFTYWPPRYVHLHRVERKKNAINVYYRFVLHESAIQTEHFALIPMGKLSSGKYCVNFMQIPMEKKTIDMGVRPLPKSTVAKSICKSFKFTILE